MQKHKNKELERSKDVAKIEFFKKLVTSIEELNQIMSNISDDNTLRGIKLFHDNLWKIFSNEGFKKLNTSIGEEFDHEKHEAVMSEPAKKEEEKNKISAVFQKGYTYKDEIIIYPKVKIYV